MKRASPCPNNVRGLEDQLGFEIEVEDGVAETVISLIATTGAPSGLRRNDVLGDSNLFASKPPKVREAGTPLRPEII